MSASARRRFRPRLWTTVATLPVMAILLALGFWQLERLEWKNALTAEMRSRLDAQAIALPQPVPSDLSKLRYRRVALEGRLLHDRDLYRKAQPLRNTRGAHVITPMALADGRQVLVNRGWVPLDRLDQPNGYSQPEGRVRLQAVIREGGWDGMTWLRPANDPAENTWLWMDLDRMAKAAELSNPVTRLYVDAVDGANPGEYPVGGQTRVNLRNDHLNYALTWFALALGLAVIYVLFHWQRKEEESAA